MSIPVPTMAEMSVETTTSPKQLRRRKSQKVSNANTEESFTNFDSPLSTSPLSGNLSDLDSTPLSKVYSPMHQHNHPNRNGQRDLSLIAVHGSVPSSPLLKGFKTASPSLTAQETVQEVEDKHEDVPELPLSPQAEKTRAKGDKAPTKVDDDEWIDIDDEAADVKVIPPKPVLNTSNLVAVAEAMTPREQLLNHRVIALDFDDVVAQSIQALCDEHNAIYGTDLTIDDMQSYIYFHNRGWGTPAEVARKMQKLDNILPKTSPIPGFAEGLKALHAMGHPLHIITARSESHKEAVIEWLAQQGITVGLQEGDTVAAIWFTDTYKGTQPELGEKGEGPEDEKREAELNERLRAVYRDGVGKGKGGLAKLNVLRAIGASLFIDDHHANLEPCLTTKPQIQCILYGAWPWNQVRSGVSSPVELMSWDERQRAGVVMPTVPIHHDEDKGLHRAKDWDAVVKWVKNWDRSQAVTEAQIDDSSTAAVVEDMSYTDDQVEESVAVPRPPFGSAYDEKIPPFHSIYNDRIIAVDFDAIVCRNVDDYIREQKEVYGVDVTLADIHDWIWGENKGRGWGTRAETDEKLRQMEEILPGTFGVAGFHQTLYCLRKLGHSVHLISSRSESEREKITKWLSKHCNRIGFGTGNDISALWLTGEAALSSMKDRIDGAMNRMMEEECQKEGNHRGSCGVSVKRCLFENLQPWVVHALSAIKPSLYVTDWHANLRPILDFHPDMPCLLLRRPPPGRAQVGAKGNAPYECYTQHEEKLLFGRRLSAHVATRDGLVDNETWLGVTRWIRRWDADFEGKKVYTASP